MRHIALFSSAGLALMIPLASLAAESTNFQVTGTISPASCDVSLGDSNVKLDPVSLSDFTPGQDLALNPKTASLTVNCLGASAKFRLKASDSVNMGVSTPGDAHYSLGRNEQGGKNKPNGYFKLSIDADAMSSNKFVLKSTDKGEGKAWATPVSGPVPFTHDGEAFAFAADASATEPADLTSLTVPLKVEAVLAKDPVVIEDVALAGQATIEIFY
jgi:type 1 fimbria pilin